jgi:hypothetical protein
MFIKVEWDLSSEELENLSYKEAMDKSALAPVIEIPDEIEEGFISDWISDKYGFCHYGWLPILWRVK